MNSPQVRLTVDHMRHEIVYAFGAYSDEMQKELDTALKAAIKNFDFAAEVRVIAHNLLHDMILNAIRTSIQWDARVRAAVAQAIGEEPRP